MSDLTDALEWVEAEWWTKNRINSPLGVVIAAARRVAEAPQVWWCEEHDISSYSEAGCVFSDSRALPCRMVRKLLVDPAEET